MNNTLLYALTVIIWGSTWIAIKFQLGSVSIVVSIAHRSMLAALLMFGWMLWRRQQRAPAAPLSRRDHLGILFQGLFLFSVNYLFIYYATGTLTTGMVAVVFSTIVILNIINGALFLGIPASRMVALGALVGLLGMVALFWPELQSFSLEDASFRALLLCFCGVCCASVGNMFAVRNTRAGLPVLTCNAWGMFYGALFLYLLAILSGERITIAWEAPYILSLLYLAVFGSMVAFWAYVTLIGNIGPDRAAYSSLLFPVVALIISTVVEDFQWSGLALSGLALVLLGNWLVMRQGTV